MTERGRFLTLEGIEGVGKTVNRAFIADWLTQKGIEFIETREPGGTPLAEEIRDILLRPREETMASDCELLLIFAARAQHVHARIEPALSRGMWVLCDRFTDATYAYQGAGRGLPVDLIARAEALVQPLLCPDRTWLLDAPVETGLLRARKRSQPDRFETETLAFFQRIRDAYLDRAGAEPGRFRVLDASRPLDTVQSAIAADLSELAGAPV